MDMWPCPSHPRVDDSPDPSLPYENASPSEAGTMCGLSLVPNAEHYRPGQTHSSHHWACWKGRKQKHQAGVGAEPAACTESLPGPPILPFCLLPSILPQTCGKWLRIYFFGGKKKVKSMAILNSWEPQLRRQDSLNHRKNRKLFLIMYSSRT